MALYRKMPVVIEAHQIGTDGWPESIWDGVMSNQIILHLNRIDRKTIIGHVEIHKPKGVMRGEVGDWIIRGVEGEFYPCSDSVFKTTYKEVT